VKVTILPSTVARDDDGQSQYCTSFLVNDTLAVDAGTLGFFGSPHEQARVRHVLISHTHIDHVASLPIFIENAFENKPDCVTIHGSPFVLECLQRDMFNNRIWPDFIALGKPEAPFLKLSPLEAHKTVELEGLRITPVEVNHVVPTFGYIVDDRSSAMIVAGDTGPTDELWAWANRTPHLKAVFLEACFPNEMEWLAKVSKHLTPTQFGREVQKLTQPVPVFAVHIKSRFRQAVVNELRALGLPNVHIAEMGKCYTL
jgi:cAMP phosphodiesterase